MSKILNFRTSKPGPGTSPPLLCESRLGAWEAGLAALWAAVSSDSCLEARGGGAGRGQWEGRAPGKCAYWMPRLHLHLPDLTGILMYSQQTSVRSLGVGVHFDNGLNYVLYSFFFFFLVKDSSQSNTLHLIVMSL